jgi:hypothetical protein
VIDIAKRIQVVFGTGLPLGQRGLFTYEGENWIALPQSKYQAVCAVTDRLIGALAGVQRDLNQLLAAYPEDAVRIGKILEILARVEQFRQQALADKTEARTQ